MNYLDLNLLTILAFVYDDIESTDGAVARWILKPVEYLRQAGVKE